LADDRDATGSGELDDREVRLGRRDDVDGVGFFEVEQSGEIGPRGGAGDAVERSGLAGGGAVAVDERDDFNGGEARPSCVVEAAEITGAEADAAEFFHGGRGGGGARGGGVERRGVAAVP